MRILWTWLLDFQWWHLMFIGGSSCGQRILCTDCLLKLLKSSSLDAKLCEPEFNHIHKVSSLLIITFNLHFHTIWPSLQTLSLDQTNMIFRILQPHYLILLLQLAACMTLPSFMYVILVLFKARINTDKYDRFLSVQGMLGSDKPCDFIFYSWHS